MLPWATLARTASVVDLRPYSTAPPRGPRDHTLSAVPFAVSREAALTAFNAYHTHGVLLPRSPPRADIVSDVLLPFWAVSAGGEVALHAASLGFDRYERVWDAATRKWRSQQVTVWRSVDFSPPRVLPFDVAPTDPAAQVYASFRHSRRDADAARPGPALAAATAVGDVAGRADGSAVPVDAFQLPPADAVALAMARAKAVMAERIAAALKHEFRCDHVAGLELELFPDDISAAPVFAPAFVITYRHYGAVITTIVGAAFHPPIAAGPRPLDEARVAAVAGGTSVVAMVIAGGPPTWLGVGAVAWGLGLALPSAAAAVGALWAPQVLAWLGRAETAAAEKASAQAANADWDAYVRAAADADARARARARTRESRSGAADADASWKGPAGDRAEYYKTLGCAADASAADVSAAFRGAALAHHPDRLPADATDAQKAAASAKFRRIVAAYSVLRDPEKRKRYDRGEVV